MSEPAVWWTSPEVNRTVLDYHDRNARFPAEQLSEAKKELERILPSVRDAMEKEGIRYQVDCTGSAHYERTHIARWDGRLRLDIELVMDGTNVDVSSDEACGRVLNGDKANLPRVFFDSQDQGAGSATSGSTIGLLSATNVLQTFLKIVRTATAGDHITFATSGPAIQMAVVRGSETWFTVDLVPVISVPGVGNFVPKQKQCGKKSPFAWRQSFTREERASLPEDGPHYARRCLRILKAFCSRHYALKRLKSYPLKNIFLWELKEKPQNEHWTEDKVARRTIDLLLRLSTCLKEGKVPPLFGDDPVNLLATQKRKALQVMHEHVDKVCHDEKVFIRAFSE